jgi:hypothetical protein
MAKKSKSMTVAEFERTLSLNWQPEVLPPERRPGWLRGIPDEKVYAVLGSGSIVIPPPHADQNATIRGQIGGIDVYRHAEPSDGVKLNKDWYRVVQDPDDPDHLFVLGPVRDQEHWIDALPARLKHLEGEIKRPKA